MNKNGEHLLNNIFNSVKSTPISIEKLLEIGFENYINDNGLKSYRKFSFSVSIINTDKFVFYWYGGNTEIKTMEHLNQIHYFLVGDFLF